MLLAAFGCCARREPPLGGRAAAQAARMSAAAGARAAAPEAAALPVRAHAKVITEAVRDNTVTVRARVTCMTLPL